MLTLRLTVLCALGCTVQLSGLAKAQGTSDSYPSRAVSVIVPYAAGGPVDIEARLHARKMSELMGQSFVLDFKPGAAATLGAAYVAKAAPDGYTLLVTSGGLAVSPAFYKDLPYDTVKDLAPVSLMTQKSTVLLAHPAFPPRNFVEYIAYAKANPGKVNFGTSGAGSISHLGGAWMHNATNTQVTFVHYKGSGPIMLDLTAGRVDVAPVTFLTSLPMIKSGKVRALALMNDKRSKVLPEVLTIAEQGLPDYNYSNWLGFLAPGRTPATIVNKLSNGFSRVAKMPDIAASLQADGGVAVGSTPAEFRQVIVTEIARWKKLVEDNGIKVEE